MSKEKKNLETKINYTINFCKNAKVNENNREKGYKLSMLIADLGLLLNLLNKDYVNDNMICFVEELYNQVNKNYTSEPVKGCNCHVKHYSKEDIEKCFEKGVRGIDAPIHISPNVDVNVKGLNYPVRVLQNDPEEKEDIKEYLNDLVGGNVEITDSMIEEFLAAQKILGKQRNFKKEHKGQNVKRVPPAPAGIDEIASSIGLDDLAKEIGVKRAKPLFADYEKKNGVTKMIHKDNKELTRKEISESLDNLLTTVCENGGFTKEELDKVLSDKSQSENYCKESSIEEKINDVTNKFYDGRLTKEDIVSGKLIKDIEKALSELSKSDLVSLLPSVTKEDVDNAIKKLEPFETEKQKPVTWLPTVDKLEKLVGKLTSEELAVKRKLVLAKRALDLAMDKIYDMPTEDIINGQVMSSEDFLKQEWENLFSHKKY